MFCIAIVGKNGQLGRELVRQAPSKDTAVHAFSRADLDISDGAAVEPCLSKEPFDLVINAAAYTAVDQAESDPQRAYAVNADGPNHLAAFCAGSHTPLMHVSTDYVFDGTQNGPYRETDPIAPLGIYGQSKALGEAHVRRQLPAHVIVRTAWLYSAHGHNFVKTMLRLGREKTELKVVDDQHGCPTSAADLAAGIWQMVPSLRRNEPRCWGTYHFCNRGETTWYGLARAVFEAARRRWGDALRLERLVPIPTAAYPTPAQRPAYSVLNCDRVQETFGIHIREWQAALWDTLDELLGG